MRLLSAIAGAFLLVVALTTDVEADTERRHPRKSLFNYDIGILLNYNIKSPLIKVKPDFNSAIVWTKSLISVTPSRIKVLKFWSRTLVVRSNRVK